MKKDTFNSIMRGAKEAVAHAKGEKNTCIEHKVSVPDRVDVKAIRKKLDMTQQKFSETFGFPLPTLKNWETNRRTPEKSARLLLLIISKNPKMVLKCASPLQ